MHHGTLNIWENIKKQTTNFYCHYSLVRLEPFFSCNNNIQNKRITQPSFYYVFFLHKTQNILFFFNNELMSFFCIIYFSDPCGMYNKTFIQKLRKTKSQMIMNNSLNLKCRRKENECLRINWEKKRWKTIKNTFHEKRLWIQIHVYYFNKILLLCVSHNFSV